MAQDDLLYALMIWKYYGVFLLCGSAFAARRRSVGACGFRWCSAAMVAVIAILQSMQLFGVLRLLGSLYSAYGDVRSGANSSGGSMLSLPIAVADLMILNSRSRGG